MQTHTHPHTHTHTHTHTYAYMIHTYVHILHLHKIGDQFDIIRLKSCKLSQSLIAPGREFHRVAP
jgi:hypothetical protein